MLADSSPSDAVIARILTEDRTVTPDTDLSALLAELEGQDYQIDEFKDVTVRIARDSRGSAGFAFDCASLQITSVKKDRRDLSTLRVGDTIVAVNGAAIQTLSEYKRAAKGVRNFTLTVRQRADPAEPKQTKPAPKSLAGRVRGPSEAERRAMTLDIDNMSYEELLALDEIHPPVKKAGLPDAITRKLPVENVCGGSGECAICLEDFCDGDEATCLPCSHMFHLSCAKEWLQRQSRCPYCNFDFCG
jgi:hypothetical protein